MFLHEAPEQAIPDHQHAGIVAVEVARIGCMMHSMMRRRVEQVLEPAGHAVNGFGMNPKLIEQVEALLRQDHRRWKTQQGQRNPRGPGADDDAGPRLTDGRRQIVFLRRVMVDVRRPPEAAFVADAMEPVVDEVIEKKDRQPGPGRARRYVEQPDLVGCRQSREYGAGHQEIHHDIAGLHAERCKGVCESIAGLDHGRAAQCRLERNHPEGNAEENLRQMRLPIHGRNRKILRPACR